MATPISPRTSRDFVDALFGEDLHLKRIESLSNATTGVVRSASLGISIIGAGLALARNTEKKHAVKQVDRLIGNDAIDVFTLAARWVPYVIAARPEAWIALDWTDFEADGHATLVASLISTHGRSTPLLWRTFAAADIKGSRLEAEELVLKRLRETLPPTVTRALLLCDRGFSDVARWEMFQRHGFDFITRIKAAFFVTDDRGRQKSAGEWLAASGKATTLRGVTVTATKAPIASFVAVKARDMKEPWFLVSSLSDAKGSELVERYGRRFTIEESFRDVKDLRFGMGLANVRVSSPSRRDRLFLLSALAVALLTILGAAGEAAGIDKHFKVNTSKKRQFSLFRQGCDYYEFLPGMREAWAQPLLEKFYELLRGHAVFADVLGII
jgi:hypothetical protein